MASNLVLTPEDRAVIQDKKNEQQAIIDGSNRTIKDITEVQIPKNNQKEATNKKIWDFQHGCITQYEAEYTNLNGTVITAPVVEQDLFDRANETGRLFDASYHERDIIRIAQFDGGPTTVNPDSEFTRLTDGLYLVYFNWLQLGLNTDTGISNVTRTACSSSGGTFECLSDVSGLKTKEFIITDGPNSFIALCTDVTPIIPPGPIVIPPPVVPDPPLPPTGYTVTYTAITTSGTLSSGASFTGSWHGFSDLERTNKLSGGYQNVLDFWLDKVMSQLNPHLGFINNQKTALIANKADNLPATALANVNAALSFYNGWIAGNLPTVNPKDISDLGITNFKNYNTNRLAQVNARIPELISNRVSFFEKRFFWSVERCGASGTLVIAKLFDKSIVNATNRKNAAQTKLNQLNSGEMM